MKRSVQEIIELLVFGLIAVLIGTGVLWLVGWAIGGLGALFKLLAGLIWSLLRFVVPIAVVGAAVYALVRLLQGHRGPEPASASASAGTTAPKGASAGTSAPKGAKPATSTPPPAEATSTRAVEPSADRAAVVDEAVTDQDAGADEATDDDAERKPRATMHEASGDATGHDPEDHHDSDDESTDEDHRA